MTFYEQTLQEIIKCSKPKSSSNANLHPPDDWDMEWGTYDPDSPFAPKDTYNFRESDRNGNMFTNLETKQIDLQDKNTNFTEKQELEVSSYFGTGYMWINGILYDSPSFKNNFTNRLIEHYKEKINKTVYSIDQAIANSQPLAQNTKLYSRMRINPDVKEGEIGKWDGYVSTSFYKDSTFSQSSEDYDVEILAVEGVKGICGNGSPKHIDTGMKYLSIHPAEEEFLLGRNTQYLMVKRNDNTKTATVLVF